MSAPPDDFRSTSRARRQSWFGAKRWVKKTLSWRLPHVALRTAVRLGNVDHGGRLPAPASLREVSARLDDGTTFFMLDPARCVVAKELYWGQGRRVHAQDAYAIDLFARLARHAGTVLDVGAYTGLFSLAAASVNTTCDVHAFEIVPAVSELLKRNIDRNGFREQIVVHTEGVGDPSRTLQMPAAVAGASALPDFYSAQLRFEGGVEVPMVSLDSLSPLAHGGVLMKIDVEGGEGEIVAHGRGFLGQHRPDILCEILPASDPAPVQEALGELDYSFYVVRSGRLEQRDVITGLEDHRDWLFTTRGPADLAELGIPA